MAGFGKVREFSDFDLDFGIHPIKKDINKLKDQRAVQQALKTLILTKHYERPFHPELGCNVTEMLFEHITPFTAANIRRSIEEVIENFEPRVRLREVEVEAFPDRNAYRATINFFIVNQAEPIEVDIFLERLR